MWAENYRQALIDLSDNVGPAAERFLILSIGFFLGEAIFAVVLLVHTSIAGLKNSDRDLVTFFLPLAVALSLVFFIPYLLILKMGINLSHLIALNLIALLFKIFIAIDVFKYLSSKTGIGFDLWNPSKDFILRKTVKGMTICFEENVGGEK